MTRRYTRVDWDLLSEFNLSDEGTSPSKLDATRFPLTQCSHQSSGQDFIRNLLEHDPKKRVSLTEAASHEWLAELGNLPNEYEHRPRPARAPVATSAPTPKSANATKPASKGSRKTPAPAPSKDPTEALIQSLTSMSISNSDLPVSSRTRAAAKQKAAAAASSAVGPSCESIPGLGTLRRSSRIAAKNGISLAG